LAAGDFGVLADFDWGKGEMVKQKRGMDTLTGERGKGKAEKRNEYVNRGKGKG